MFRSFTKRTTSVDANPPIGRNFRTVLQDVQAGRDELGESVSPDMYTFKSTEEVDMDLDPPELYLSRHKYGTIGETDFTDRLSRRLGLDSVPKTPENTPPEDLPTE